jgi:hypothetical protein
MRLARRLPVVAGLLLLAGCAAGDPLERVVSVPTAGRFATWRAHVASDTGADMRRRVEEALQEIRLKVSGDRELKRVLGETVTPGTDAIDEEVRQRVDGRRLREVLQLGYELRVRRLKEELVGLEDAMTQNAKLVTKPGDVESRHHLEGLQERQRARVEKYRADIALAERELAPLEAKTGRRLMPPPTEPVEPVRVKKPGGNAKI